MTFKKARTQIENAAIEGDYILSAKSASALSTLIKQLRKETGLPKIFTLIDWINYLYDDLMAAKDCLKTLRDEAKLDLRVK